MIKTEEILKTKIKWFLEHEHDEWVHEWKSKKDQKEYGPAYCCKNSAVCHKQIEKYIDVAEILIKNPDVSQEKIEIYYPCGCVFSIFKDEDGDWDYDGEKGESCYQDP